MTVKELIEVLKTLDENLTVICYGEYDHTAPHPTVRKHEFSTTYWDGNDFVSIEKDTEFIEL